jgi:hypothetical protein
MSDRELMLMKIKLELRRRLRKSRGNLVSQGKSSSRAREPRPEKV